MGIFVTIMKVIYMKMSEIKVVYVDHMKVI
jgi:hypothetical protein